MVFSDRSGAFGDPKPNLHDLNGKIASGRQLAKVLKLPIRLAKLQQEKPRLTLKAPLEIFAHLPDA
jgi:uncharacterized membrane protein